MDSPIRVRALLWGIQVNHCEFKFQVPLSQYERVLGQPSRSIDAGTEPAPHGHRNNQVHVYDELGLSLSEHHATGLVTSLNIVFDPDRVLFPPNHPFSGSLLLDGQRTDAATTLADLERHPTTSFRRHFNDGLYAEGEAVIIDVSVRDWRSKGKQRKRSLTVAWVALQFRDRCESVAENSGAG